jgi:hypothetical protein
MTWAIRTGYGCWIWTGIFTKCFPSRLLTNERQRTNRSNGVEGNAKVHDVDGIKAMAAGLDARVDPMSHYDGVE